MSVFVGVLSIVASRSEMYAFAILHNVGSVATLVLSVHGVARWTNAGVAFLVIHLVRSTVGYTVSL